MRTGTCLFANVLETQRGPGPSVAVRARDQPGRRAVTLGMGGPARTRALGCTACLRFATRWRAACVWVDRIRMCISILQYAYVAQLASPPVRYLAAPYDIRCGTLHGFSCTLGWADSGHCAGADARITAGPAAPARGDHSLCQLHEWGHMRPERGTGGHTSTAVRRLQVRLTVRWCRHATPLHDILLPF